jgi:hypothetical protein
VKACPAGEDHLAAAHRELREELERDGFRIGPWDGEHPRGALLSAALRSSGVVTTPRDLAGLPDGDLGA